MFRSIVARTFRLARRSWARTVAAWLVAAVVAVVIITTMGLLARVLLGGAVEAVLGGAPTGADAGRVLTLGLPLGLVIAATSAWLQFVPIRAASGEHALFAAMRGAVPGAWRMLPLYALVGAVEVVLVALDPSGILLLIGLVVLSVPVMAAMAQLALEPGSWGLDLLWRRGLRRAHRNVGAYLAVAFVLVATALVVAAAFVLPLVLIAGSPPSGPQGDLDALAAWARDSVLAIALGSVLALIPAITLPNALAVAVREGLTGALDHAQWEDEDEAPFRVSSELSPAVQQLVGTAAQRSRRLTLPPRAPEPGRIPGPGVLAVAGVDLPAGRATRNVEAATLELAVGDGSPGATSHDEQLWITRDALEATPALWKRLAAGFSETGLWPLALPVAGTAGSVDWFEHAARRDADPDELRPDVAERLRVRLAESLDDGTPLRSTDLLRTSHAARGELMSGGGRRTDALSFAFEAVGPARLGLVPARRPADVLHALAWPGAAAAGIPTDELADVVASWERRYAALLVGLGEASLVFAVLRPPGTVDEAVEVVAEHHALCPDEAAGWGDDLSAARTLVDAPTWRLSWH